MPSSASDIKWVSDTSVYTHLSRANHLDILRQLAPSGVLLIPGEVHVEIEKGRETYADIVSVNDLPWGKIVILTEDDELDLRDAIKARMGGDETEHLGECAVIAYSKMHGHSPLLDERAARKQAEAQGLIPFTTLWLVIEAWYRLKNQDRTWADGVVRDLVSTGMWLPIDDGPGLFVHAYEREWLPR